MYNNNYYFILQSHAVYFTNKYNGIIIISLLLIALKAFADLTTKRIDNKRLHIRPIDKAEKKNNKLGKYANSVKVTNIGNRITKEDIIRIFSLCGTVKKVSNPSEHKHIRYVIITFDNQESGIFILI